LSEARSIERSEAASLSLLRRRSAFGYLSIDILSSRDWYPSGI